MAWTALANERIAIAVELATDRALLALTNNALFWSLPRRRVAGQALFPSGSLSQVLKVIAKAFSQLRVIFASRARKATFLVKGRCKLTSLEEAFAYVLWAGLAGWNRPLGLLVIDYVAKCAFASEAYQNK